MSHSDSGGAGLAHGSMKYRGVRALPASVALWLEQQLEERGIDSIIYTRYILSLLQDDSIDVNDLPSFSKATKRISDWKTCNLEELKRTAVVECLTEATDQAIEIESLVDELCTKLKEVESEDTGNCLKEKTNSEDLFNLELPVSSPDLASKYYSAFPALSRDTIGFESSLLEKSAWTKNICRALGRRREPESSPKENKITKRKEGKENARGRMRSRSTVKSQSSQRSRSAMAKSLDRSEKGRKCLFGKEEKHLTIGREEEYEKYLPMDFQSLLQSPENNSQEYFRTKTSQPVSGNFIQCGTNITSSIWSSEKMEEDESMPWEEVGKYVGWSDARNSLLSSAWKLPFVYGNNNNKKEEDIEGTTLNLKNDGAFFSLFNDNSNHLSLLKATNLIDKSDQKKVEPPEQLENLLTSMKTHFKPIKQESVEINASSYNDGSSFVGANFLEEVKFRRSESGSLYLGHDQKYMEYKRPDLTVSPNFVPKFRVCSNEKFCQTDDPPPEEDTSALDQNIESEFFFPGDDRYAEDALNECSPCIEVRGWVTTWPIAPASDDIWSNDSRQPWVIGENENWSSTGVGRREDYTRLRREITQEGEQLLSDLRSINLLQDHRPQKLDQYSREIETSVHVLGDMPVQHAPHNLSTQRKAQDYEAVRREGIPLLEENVLLIGSSGM